MGQSFASPEERDRQEGGKSFPKQVLLFWPRVLCDKGPDWQTGGCHRDDLSRVSRTSHGTAVLPERETHGGGLRRDIAVDLHLLGQDLKSSLSPL